MIAMRRFSPSAVRTPCCRPEDFQNEAFDADLIYVANLSNESADCFPLMLIEPKGTMLSSQ